MPFSMFTCSFLMYTGLMKKILLPLLALSALSSASAAERVGFYILGAQYERDLNASDSFRLGLGLPIAGVFQGTGVLGGSGSAAWLRHTRALNADGTGVQPYYGAGLGLAAFGASSSGTSASALVVFPHVLGGANLGLNSRWALFAEAGAGANFYVAGSQSAGLSDSRSGLTPSAVIRLGATYRIR